MIGLRQLSHFSCLGVKLILISWMRMFSLKDKVACVTGASQGIGQAIALALAHQGAHVVCVARNEQNLKQTVGLIEAQKGTAEAFVADLSQFAESKRLVDAIIAKHGMLHCLVNNAGITKDKLLIQMKEHEWDDVLDTNLKAVFGLIQAATRPMMKQRWGRIVNISSVVGQMGNAGQINYVSSKAGLIGLTKSVARELASRNITCNAIAPGYIESPMTGHLQADVTQAFIDQIPMGRLGTGIDIASAVVFLCSEESSYITGETLAVNGGMLMA